MENTEYTPKYPLHTLSKALEILNYIKDCSSADGVTLGAISKALKLSKSSTHRILDTLLSYGFLEKSGTGIVSYNLSWNAYKVGSVVPKLHTLNSSGYAAILENMSKALDKTVSISVNEKNMAFVLYKIEPGFSVQPKSFFGQHNPLYASAAGKLFMLNFNKDSILNYFQSTDIKKYTSNTILNYIDFLEELNTIRKNGFSTDNCEYNENTVCVAMPVLDYSGTIVASISVSDKADAITDSFISQVKPHLSDACDRLSSFLGY